MTVSDLSGNAETNDGTACCVNDAVEKDLVLKLNDQLRETKKELDSLIQLKQTNLGTTSVNVIPTVTTIVPSTLAASLAPTAPRATTLLVSTTSTLEIRTSSEEAGKLVKAMEEMSIQTTQMNKLKEKVTSLEIDYKLAKIMHKEELQKATRMSERLKAWKKT